jgi:hypothetical protein
MFFSDDLFRVRPKADMYWLIKIGATRFTINERNVYLLPKCRFIRRPYSHQALKLSIFQGKFLASHLFSIGLVKHDDDDFAALRACD